MSVPACSLIYELERFEDDAEEVTSLARRLRPPTQYLLAGLGAGNEKAYTGRSRWLFYRLGLDYLTGPGVLEPGQLARRGASRGLGNRH
jgi:alginate O-acetyltransferase complex protein AlgJ